MVLRGLEVLECGSLVSGGACRERDSEKAPETTLACPAFPLAHQMIKLVASTIRHSLTPYIHDSTGPLILQVGLIYLSVLLGYNNSLYGIRDRHVHSKRRRLPPLSFRGK